MTRFGQADQFRPTVLPIFNTSFYIHLFRSASIIKQDATETPRLQVGTTWLSVKRYSVQVWDSYDSKK